MLFVSRFTVNIRSLPHSLNLEEIISSNKKKPSKKSNPKDRNIPLVVLSSQVYTPVEICMYRGISPPLHANTTHVVIIVDGTENRPPSMLACF